jgi:hypothetical protein
LRQHRPLKLWCPHTTLHVITTQKTSSSIAIARIYNNMTIPVLPLSYTILSNVLIC